MTVGMYFGWVKAHVSNNDNKLATQLTKGVPSNNKCPYLFELIRKSEIFAEQDTEAWKTRKTNGQIQQKEYRLNWFFQLLNKENHFITSHHYITEFNDFSFKSWKHSIIFLLFQELRWSNCICKSGEETVRYFFYEHNKLHKERTALRKMLHGVVDTGLYKKMIWRQNNTSFLQIC